MNSYEMTSKTDFSSKSSGNGASLLNNMKAMIVHQDKKIQEKLKQLNELKETMTQPVSANTH